MNLAKIKETRRNLQIQLQNGYNKQNSYAERLKYIYKVLITSQQYYLKWKSKGCLCDKYLDELLNNINEQNITREDMFIDFIHEKVIKPINSGHVNLVPHKIIKEEQILKKETNDTELLKNSNISVEFKEDTVIVSIKSFTNSNDCDKKIFDNLETVLIQNDYDNIIIDIRGNGRWN